MKYKIESIIEKPNHLVVRVSYDEGKMLKTFSMDISYLENYKFLDEIKRILGQEKEEKSVVIPKKMGEFEI